MQETLTTRDVCEGAARLLVAARPGAQTSFPRGVVDSREAAAGDLFFAIPGDRADGHAFAPAALAAGAAGAVVERPLDLPHSASVFHVSSSAGALQAIASHRRRQAPALPVVGVTGSVGKTTCKEMVAAVLGARFRVLKSEANLNTEIGVPLTLLGLRPEHDCAVLEMGMYQRGDIALLARIAAPEIGIVTNVGPVHLERLGSIGAITAAKAELVEALPASGLAVLNGDDPRTAAMASRTRARSVLFGSSEQCAVRALSVESHGLEGISFELDSPSGRARVTCPMPGRHHVYPALAAVAVALELGLGLREIAAGLASARPGARLRILAGPNGSTIIDDSYNASPASMIAALDLLSELPGRRVAVLGEMRELGAASDDGHRQVGRRAATACDMLIVCGPSARLIADEAREAGHQDVRFFESDEQTLETLTQELQPGDHALIKASRAMAWEHLVEALTTG